MDHPNNNPFYFHTVFGGDNRQGVGGAAVFDSSNTSFRTRQNVTVRPIDILASDDAAMVLESIGHTPVVGATNEYHKASSVIGGAILPEAKADTVLNDGFLKIATAVAGTGGMTAGVAQFSPNILELKIDTVANNPLITSPSIDFHINLSFDYTDPENPAVEYNIVHDGFPCYELSIDDTLVYTFDSAGNSPTALFGVGDVSAIGAKTLPKPERLP